MTMSITHRLAAVGVLAAATVTATAGPASLNTDTIYRLEQTATFQEGCFEPCLCPISSASMRGALVLGPVMVGDVVNFQEVKDINWRVGDDVTNVVHTITGSGIYRRTNFGEPVMHAIELDLSIDGGPVQHFFSEFQPASNDGSLDLAVSMNGMVCHDIVIQLDGVIVPPNEITRYRLIDGSTYQEGCFEPCDCALLEPRPMRGGFLLVPILDYGTYAEYAVVSASFVAPAPSNVVPPVSVQGNGFYTLIQGFAGPMQAMDLWMSVNGGELTDFDSELENIEPIFPAISVTVDMNDQVCFDIILAMNAVPVNAGGLAPLKLMNSGAN